MAVKKRVSKRTLMVRALCIVLAVLMAGSSLLALLGVFS